MPIEFKDACLVLSAPYKGKPRLSLKQPCEQKSDDPGTIPMIQRVIVSAFESSMAFANRHRYSPACCLFAPASVLSVGVHPHPVPVGLRVLKIICALDEAWF